MERLLPNLIIAGAPKAGTSSLFRWLADHPDALGSSEKETYYFVDTDSHMYRPESHIGNGLEDYHAFFRNQSSETPRVILESTPTYLYYETALTMLPELESRPKFVFVLREPSEQVYSVFRYLKNNWSAIPEEMTFAQFISRIRDHNDRFGGNDFAQHALRNAVYVDYLKRWRERAGSSRMAIWLFDDLRRDTKKFTQEVARFCGLDPEYYETYNFPRENETYQPRSAGLQKFNVAIRGLLPKGRVYSRLRNIYRQLNTTKPTPPSDEDREMMSTLRMEFSSNNQELASEFNLDLTPWSQR